MPPNSAVDRVAMEALITLSQVPSLLSQSASGRKLAIAVIHRWARDGIPGPDGARVRLESVRVGGRWLTSRQAVTRFVIESKMYAGRFRH